MSFADKKVLKVLVLITILMFFTACYFVPMVEGGVWADLTGLKGTSGFTVDNLGDKMMNYAMNSNPAYSAATNSYDIITGLQKMYNGQADALDVLDVGASAVGVYLIVGGILAGTITLPAAVTIGLVVGAVKLSIGAVKSIQADLLPLLSWLKKHIGNPILNLFGVYKPNIYIYSDTNMEVNVKIIQHHYITESIPRYDAERGWDAKIVDGSINGCNDYLFYEAEVPDPCWQKNEAFFIRGKFLKSDLAEMLERYQFNQKESDDFLEYWLEKLEENNDYLFYPQYNDVLDKIMKLEITPEPENLFRVWFLIEPYTGQGASEIKENLRILRTEYTIVEWGGIMKQPR